jgi:diguanylate cyclase (GGDEF)-like protein/PAS domain S-box-containing protein
VNAIQPLTGLAALIILILGVICVLLARSRRSSNDRLKQFHAELKEVASVSGFGRRIDPIADAVDLNDLGGSINKLFDALHAREEQIQQREQLFKNLANTLPEVVLIHNEKVVYANREAGELLGVTQEELIGRDVADMVRPAYRRLVNNVIQQQMDGQKKGVRYELQLIDGQERARWAEATAMRIRYRGEPVVLTVARDISYRKSVEATLGRGRQQAQITLESLGEGVITADTAGHIDYMNAAAEKLTGTNRADALGHSFGDVVKLVEDEGGRDLGDPVSRCLLKRQRISLGRRALLMPSNGDGEISIDATASPIFSPDQELQGAVIIMRDVSELRGLTREMSYQASHDPLTGLVNRREFERQVNLALDAAKGEGVHHVLCYMDLDRFKAVNDTCGHMAGDNMLREVAGLLREHVRDSDLVARLGGDEFGLLLMGCPLDKARQIADDVCAAVRAYRFVWQDRIFDIGISIGMVEVSDKSGLLEDVLGAADSACYVAKQQGRGQVHIYSARDEVAARQRGEIHWLRKLQTAIRDERFVLHVQPIISVAGRVPSGPAVEVLLRMNDPEEGLVLPGEFMAAAERYQLIGQLDRWVVQATLAGIASGAIRLPDERSVAINISGQTMEEGGFLDFVVSCLDHSQVSPAQLCFEVTESAVLRDLEHARHFIGVLHGMGCSFGLDDFGSNVGSLASLQELDIDFLKLDGVCTRDIMVDSVNQEVVSAVTRLSRAVGFKVVAEQVEDQMTFDGLRDLGVNFIQGNYVEAPRPLGE